MSASSRFMAAYGMLLIVCAIFGSAMQAPTGGAAVAGVGMILAGAAAAQGRTSLRRSGLIVGMFLPVLTAALYGYRAILFWRTLGTPQSRISQALLLTVISAAGLVTMLILMKLRAGDNIAERGYSILPITPAPTPAPQPSPPEEVKRP